jgi:hypothetical protein
MNHPILSPISILQKGAFAILCLTISGLFFMTGCKKDPIDNSDPDTDTGIKPVDIQYHEYTLSSTECWWINLDYDNKVILINSKEKMESYIHPSFLSVYTKYLEIDFSKYSILLASGTSENQDAYIAKKFQKLSDNKYIIDAELFLNRRTPNCNWNFALYIDKISDESTIELKTRTLIAETDYYYNIEGQKEYLAVRKDYVVIKCKSKADLKAFCEETRDESFLPGVWSSSWGECIGSFGYDIIYVRLKPLAATLEDIMQNPHVLSVAYGFEPENQFDNRNVGFPLGYIAIEPNEGVTIEQILEELNITEYTFKILMGAPYAIFESGVLIENELNVLEISRRIFESGMCKYAFPYLCPQVWLCM